MAVRAGLENLGNARLATVVAVGNVQDRDSGDGVVNKQHLLKLLQRFGSVQHIQFSVDDSVAYRFRLYQDGAHPPILLAAFHSIKACVESPFPS